MDPQPISQLLENRKLEPQKPGLQLLKTGELSKLEKAVLSPLIMHTGPDELSQVLRFVMLKLGIRANNLPNPEETVVLLSHIVENYGGHRAEEIKLAFEMAIAGKLEIDDINPYENFSCAYFSKIMNAYRAWSSQAIKQLKTEDPPPQVLYTTEQMEDQQRGDIEHFYQRLRKGQVPYKIPEYFKAILVKDGLMTPEQEMPEFFMTKLGNQVEKIYVRDEP